MKSNDAYLKLVEHLQKTHRFGAALGLLHWDQEVKMPDNSRANAFRSEQVSDMSRMYHAMCVDERVGEWLSACEADSALVSDEVSVAGVNVREARRAYDKETKLPEALVGEIARTTAVAQSVWAEARRENDFSKFAPHLKQIVKLMRDKADALGYPDDGERWDALADNYEPGMNAKQLEPMFASMREQLVPLVDELLEKGSAPENRLNEREVGKAEQEHFVTSIAKAVGFDLSAGRIDESTHPFCMQLHPHDVRITTRYHKNMLNDTLGSTLHEAGHGIYNQNTLWGEHVGTPIGDAGLLSVHESQSRMLENQVGRSSGFWRWCQPKLLEYFGKTFEDVNPREAYREANRVARSLIRVEADEATYNLHIMIRFELERALIGGALEVDDLPAAWNEKYKAYLGLDVPNDALGCLQDVHWACGLYGYFPTYTLGNILSAQFYAAAEKQLGDLETMYEKGEFAPLCEWLKENIHQHGMRYYANELCEKVTGQAMSAEALMTYLKTKFQDVYEIG